MSIKKIIKQNFHFHPFSSKFPAVCPKCGCLMKLIPQTNADTEIYKCPICGWIKYKRHFGISNFP